MNARELLELAAKAAGYVVEWREWVTSCLAEFGTIKHTKQSGFWLDGKQWNPLTDDGDALRLAVKLQMEVASRSIARADCIGCKIQLELLNGDPCAAIRRAIVRAAAEIGKAMP